MFPLAVARALAALICASSQEEAPPVAPAPARPPEVVAPPAPEVVHDLMIVTTQKLQGPVELPEERKLAVSRRFANVVKQVGPNVVQLSIERSVGDGVVVLLEASGLVLDEHGHVITIGSTLQQAGRIAVRFANVPQMRPRRARLVGIDEKTDVGVLDVGPIAMRTLDLSLPATAPLPTAEMRYVLTLNGVPNEPDGRVAAGWMHEPLAHPTLGAWRFDRLLRVSITRSPQCAGGVLVQQDGRVVGLMLAPAQATGGAVPTEGMLALPADVVCLGVKTVLGRPLPPPRPDSETEPATRARAWLGFGATELEEPEFLHQIGQLALPGQIGVGRAVVVSEVFEASPALAAGLEPHDVILAWDGQPLAGVDALSERLAASEPGREVALDCVRALQRRTVKVTLGAW